MSIKKSLDNYIEYATKIKKFADVGFYENIKTYIEKLEAENERLMNSVLAIGNDFTKTEIGMKQQLTDCQQKSESLKSVVKWYADAKNRSAGPSPYGYRYSKIYHDNGRKAEEALKQHNGE